jgi:hypothetical protein
MPEEPPSDIFNPVMSAHPHDVALVADDVVELKLPVQAGER